MKIVSIVLLLLPLTLAAAPTPDLPEQYKLDPTFPQLPADIKLGAVSGVATDLQGNVLIFNRAEPPVLVFDPAGKFIRSFGNGLFTSTHGLRVDPDGNIWVTDNSNHTVLKLNPEGKLLLSLGVKNEAGADEHHFNRPTDVAFARDGGVYVSDGYGNSRVVKFDKAGKFVFEWGKKGSADGEFNIPHAIRLDSKGLVYVADRENNRIQIFDAGGKFLRKITGMAPYGLFITADDTLYVADGRANAVLKMTADGKLLARWGAKGRGDGLFDMPHDLTVDGNGAVYVGDINGRHVQKFVKVPGK